MLGTVRPSVFTGPLHLGKGWSGAHRQGRTAVVGLESGRWLLGTKREAIRPSAKGTKPDMRPATAQPAPAPPRLQWSLYTPIVRSDSELTVCCSALRWVRSGNVKSIRPPTM
jgi:hypothetical protein